MTRTTRHRRSIRVRLPDRPGSLSELTRILADHDANLLRFEVASLDGPNVWDDLEFETPDGVTAGAAVRAIRAAGYEVTGLPSQWGVRDWAMEVIETLAEIVEMDNGVAIQRRLMDAVRTIAQADHGLILTDEPDGNAIAAEHRWRTLESVAGAIDPDGVRWAGDPPAIEMARIAFRGVPGTTVTPLPRSPIGGVALLLGGTPGRDVVVAVGGRPPFLAAETARMRQFVQIVGPWLARRRGDHAQIGGERGI